MTQRPPVPDVIAEEHLLLRNGEHERPVTVRIGRPTSDGSNAWSCPCELDGIDGRYVDVCGEGSLQALCLALSLVKERLQHQLERGGSFYHPDGEGPRDIGLLFGSLLRHVDGAPPK